MLGRYYLVVAFTAGLAVMVLELVGARLMAPYFGAGIYVWSALIAVTLLSLSLGYYRGGRKIDQQPEPGLIPRAFLLAGITIIIITIVFPFIASLMALYLPLALGVLLVSFLFFTFPMMQLGQIIPYCVRLTTKGAETTGRSAGSIYAYSTVGSLVGTLATGFLLIPNVSLRVILLVLAAILLGFYTYDKIRQKAITEAFLLYLIIIFLLLPLSPVKFYYPSSALTVVEKAQSIYGEITIAEDKFNQYMLINNIAQTVVPKEIAIFSQPATYFSHNYFFVLLPYLRPQAKRALVIGLGGGLLEKLFSIYNIQTEFVEIDRKVERLARKHFDLQSRVWIADGRTFLKKTKENYDFIIFDAYISDELPFYLLTKEAFAEAKERLLPNGVLAIDLICPAYGTIILPSVMRTVNSVFKNTVAYMSDPSDASTAQCIFIFASDGSLEITSPAVATLKRNLNWYKVKSVIKGGKLITDAYFPLQHSWTEVAQEWRRKNPQILEIGFLGMLFTTPMIEVATRSNLNLLSRNMRTTIEALGAFYIDAGQYPTTEHGLIALIRRKERIGMMQVPNNSSYLPAGEQLLLDPFSPDDLFRYHCPLTFKNTETINSYFMLASNGPDGDVDLDISKFEPVFRFDPKEGRKVYDGIWHLDEPVENFLYDPTNGIVSNGDIIFSRIITERRNPDYQFALKLLKQRQR